MSSFRIFEIDPGGGWLRQVNLVGNGTGAAGGVLVQSQNRGLVEWWTGMPAVSLAAGFVMQVVAPPVSLSAPTVVPGSVTWAAYGNAAWSPVAGGTVLQPGGLTFVGTNPGTPDVWYLQVQWPTPISDGWLKWFRPASGAPRLLSNGLSMNWAVLAVPAVINNYVAANDFIPRQ